LSKDESLPVADEYVSAVGHWLAGTDLTGLPEPASPIDLPAPSAPITVVRPVRLPFEMDALVKALAEARGVTMSTLIRDWITAGLTAAGQVPDPVTELRRGLERAQRALDSLTAPARPVAEGRGTAA
jgi:predicted DNA-binding protein